MIQFEKCRFLFDNSEPKISKNESIEHEESDENRDVELNQMLLSTNDLCSYTQQTPFGPYEASDPFHPYIQYNCVTVHTDFVQNEDFIKFIDNVHGIEFIKPISKYRCCMAIGRLFDIDAVCHAVHMYNFKIHPAQINEGLILKPEYLNVVDEEKNTNPDSTFLILPNGQLVTTQKHVELIMQVTGMLDSWIFYGNQA